MSLLTLIVLLGLIKLPLVALMLWLPFRSDEPAAVAVVDSSEEDGGSKALPASPRDPHPRAPWRGHRPHRRGPHGGSSLPSPPRIRRPLTRARRLTSR
jgi:hypothetical protein